MTFTIGGGNEEHEGSLNISLIIATAATQPGETSPNHGILLSIREKQRFSVLYIWILNTEPFSSTQVCSTKKIAFEIWRTVCRSPEYMTWIFNEVLFNTVVPKNLSVTM